MDYQVTSIKDLLNKEPILDYLINHIGFSDNDRIGREYVEDQIIKFLSILKQSLYVVIETPYIDKVYRNAFYNYFSSKLYLPSRDCMRLSFIETDSLSDKLNNENFERIRTGYKGFVILRPLSHAVIGRNVISKEALDTDQAQLAICRSSIPSSCLGIKTEAYGFPHSSQDGEMMTCAETTIWSIMEYFGNKYPEYTPIPPSEILEILKPTAYERQLPSNGLTFDQIASVFNHRGFGCKVYNNADNPMFKEIMACYVESGIPVAVCLESEVDQEGHAVVAVGHKVVDRTDIASSNKVEIEGKSYYIWNNLVDEFVFNDDNLVPYTVAPFNEPTKGYTGSMSWPNVKISNIIVPLNAKIYLDAEKAIGAANYIVACYMDVRDQSVIRTFLASSRSYRQYLMDNDDISAEAKDIYVKIPMPKFVWICEISDLVACERSKVNGIVIIDATNTNIISSWPVLFAQYDGDEYRLNQTDMSMEKISVPLPKEFGAYSRNLV